MREASTYQSDRTTNDSRRRQHVARYVAVALFAFCILVFCVTSTHAQASADEPFAVPTVVVPDTVLAVTWKQLLARINDDLAVVNGCRKTPHQCAVHSASKFLAIAEEGKRQEGIAKIGYINRAATFAIKAHITADNHDKWSSPLTILSRDSGDCKDYAVLKYALLRQIGFSADSVRIIIVEVKLIHKLHAVLAIRAKKGNWLILDNLTLVLVESSVALDFYQPLYELVQDGVREFKSPPRSPLLAQSRAAMKVLRTEL